MLSTDHYGIVRGQEPAYRQVAIPVAITGLQFFASIYFVIDGIDELMAPARQGLTFDLVMECLTGFALLGGVVLSSLHIRRLNRELRWKEQSLARASGALAEHIGLQFQAWGLTPGEGEVALFAMKGCDIADIARLRGAAPGTVRSQLSQIYGKAGVSSQAMLMSLFIDDLLGPTPAQPQAGRVPQRATPAEAQTG